MDILGKLPQLFQLRPEYGRIFPSYLRTYRWKGTILSRDSVTSYVCGVESHSGMSRLLFAVIDTAGDTLETLLSNSVDGIISDMAASVDSTDSSIGIAVITEQPNQDTLNTGYLFRIARGTGIAKSQRAGIKNTSMCWRCSISKPINGRLSLAKRTNGIALRDSTTKKMVWYNHSGRILEE